MDPEYILILTRYGMEPVSGNGRIVPFMRLLPENLEFDSLLDIGCGGGRFAIYVHAVRHARFKHVYGIDLDKNMLDGFEQTRKDHNLFTDCEFRLFNQSFAVLPLPDNSVQFVGSNASLHHLEKQVRIDALSEAGRVLRDDGYFAILGAMYIEHHSQREVCDLLDRTDLKWKGGGYKVVPFQGYWQIISQSLWKLLYPGEENSARKETKIFTPSDSHRVSFEWKFLELTRSPESWNTNCSIIRFKDKNIIAYREANISFDLTDSRCYSRIRIGVLDKEYREVESKSITLPPFRPHSRENNLQDPRLFIYRGQLYLNYLRYHENMKCCEQRVVQLYDDLECGEELPATLDIGGYQEKNHSHFEAGGKLYAVYATSRRHVVYCMDDWGRSTVWTTSGLSEKFGCFRGSVPPFLCNNKFYHIVHSHTENIDSSKWVNRYRTYSISVYTFQPRPPFRILEWTPEPIVLASDIGERDERRHHVIFPGGLVQGHGRWNISCGWNDWRSGILSINHKDIEERLIPFESLG